MHGALDMMAAMNKSKRRFKITVNAVTNLSLPTKVTNSWESSLRISTLQKTSNARRYTTKDEHLDTLMQAKVCFETLEEAKEIAPCVEVDAGAFRGADNLIAAIKA